MQVKQPCDRTLDLLVNGMEGVFGATGQKTVYSFILFFFFLLMMFGTVKIIILENFLDRAMMVDEEDFNSTVEAFMVESSRPS